MISYGFTKELGLPFEKVREAVAEALRLRNLVVVRGHGTFAGGVNLDEACLYTSLAEHACRVLLLVEAHSRG